LDSIADRGLGEETRQFALLLNSVVDYAIYMLDAEGVIRSWNPGGERIKGYRADEVLGRHFSLFYAPEDVAAGLPAQGLATAKQEGRFEAEGWRLRKDGTRFRANVVIDAIREQGRLIGYAKITRDITERFKAQETMQAIQRNHAHSQRMEAVGKLTLGLAHDFNNLLTVIINSLDLIGARPGADDRTRRLVETALRASDRGALLTRQLLAFGRGQDLAPEPHDINLLLRRSLELYRRAAGDSIVLELDLARELPQVEVDATQLEAAVLNLVSNSHDAMPHGGTIVLRTRLKAAANPAHPGATPTDHVCISVADNGTGMAADVQERVFEPFFTTKPVGQGSGLGLSQVFGFAAQSNGFVQLSTAPSAGTTITLCLPPMEP
jgi:PAS domain S-box-containing protein